MKNKRKALLTVLLVMILSVSILLISKIAYSFMGPDISDDLTQDGIVLNADGSLVFVPDKDLSIVANSDNFNFNDRANVTSTSKPKVVYTVDPRNTDELSTTYYVGFNIKENTFQYSHETTPELILSIYDEQGNLVNKEIPELNFVNSNGIQGYDITTKQGSFDIELEKVISVTTKMPSTTHEWTFTLTFVNLDTDQSINENANLDLEIIIAKERPKYTLADVCPDGGNFTDCMQKLHTEYPTYEDTGLYYHDGSIEGDAQDKSYRYAGNNPNNFVCLGEIQGDGSCDNVQNLYRIIGMFPFSSDGVQQSTYSDGMEYRVKLIKSEYISASELKGPQGTADDEELSVYENYTDLARVETKEGIHGFYWNTNPYSNKDNWYNLWEYGEQKATLNIALNGTYLTNLENKIGSNKIAETKWHIGGYNTSEVTAKEMFDKEMGTKSEGSYPTPEDGYLSTNTKIGLMYASDYGFAAANNDNEWTSTLYNYDDTGNSNKENNWIFNGVYEWTISRYSDYSDSAFDVYNTGYVNRYYVDGSALGVRPVFYLNSVTKLKSGESADGSQAHPYGIE